MENALIDITRPISNGSSHSAEKPSRETYAETPAYFESALQDAERLLKYAAEVGTEVDSLRSRPRSARPRHKPRRMG